MFKPFVYCRMPEDKKLPTVEIVPFINFHILPSGIFFALSFSTFTVLFYLRSLSNFSHSMFGHFLPSVILRLVILNLVFLPLVTLPSVILSSVTVSLMPICWLAGSYWQLLAYTKLYVQYTFEMQRVLKDYQTGDT